MKRIGHCFLDLLASESQMFYILLSVGDLPELNGKLHLNGNSVHRANARNEQKGASNGSSIAAYF